ncbi:MAG: DUF4124 domain-containing protein [bacterium]
MTRLQAVALAGLLAAALLPGVSRAAIYEWEDDRGTRHFTNDPRLVPAPFRERLEVLPLPEVTIFKSFVSAPEAESGARGRPRGEDPAAVCMEQVRREQDQWSQRLAQEQTELEELNKKIHRTQTSRKKNDLQRERVDLRARIAEAEEVLKQDLPARASMCGRAEHSDVARHGQAIRR